MPDRTVKIVRRAAYAAIGITATIVVGIICAAAQAASTPLTNRSFVIRNVRIFDGENIIPADSVAVADGKISAVGTSLAAPPNAEIIDGTGDTLLPGLIDSHVHLWTREVLEMGLVMGVTTELDMYMHWEDAQRWKEEEARGAFDIADFRTAGTCFTVAGGHGTEGDPDPKNLIHSAAEAQTLVDERIAHGSDYIKIIYDNGPRFAAMPRDVMAAIVNSAHKRGKMVIVHVYSPRGILDAIDAGADALAHVPVVKMPEPQFRDALKAHHVFGITTLGFTDFFFGPGRLAAKLSDDPLFALYLGPLLRRSLGQPPFNSPEHIAYADNEAALRTLRDAGAALLAGTDASNNMPAGALLHTELELMVNAGLTPLEALADATSVPAKIFSLNDRGKIATGLRADLLLVRGDPTKDIRKTHDIVAIWKQGVGVNRDRWRDEIAQKNAAWRFGAGWMPDTDSTFKGNSRVRLRVINGGPNHARSTMHVTCDVKPGIKYPFAGAMYVPGIAFGHVGRPVDLSGGSDIRFWSKETEKPTRLQCLPRVADQRRSSVRLSPAKVGKHTRFRCPSFTPMAMT